MSGYTLAPGVRDDLKAILHYIAERNPSASGRLRQTLVDRFRILGQNPLIGQSRDDLASGVRMISEGNYVILFRPTAKGVQIIQLVHAARDLDAVFRRST